MNNATFTALAEPNRFRIIELLREKPHSVNEVAISLRLRQPQASKHLNTLHKAGLVKLNPIAQRHVYELSPVPFQEIELWLKTFERQWNEKLDRLDEHLSNLKER